MSALELNQVCMKSKVCFHCLKPGHYASSCYSKKDKRCGVDGCKGFHHRLLHTKQSTRSMGAQNRYKRNDRRSAGASHANDEHDEHSEEQDDCSSKDENEEDHRAEESNDSMHSRGIKSGKVGIKVASVRVHHKNKSVIANILLDEGSNNTNINEDLAEFLDMKSIKGPVNRTLNVMGGKKVNVSSNLVKFEISPVKPPRCLSKYCVHDHTRLDNERCLWSIGSDRLEYQEERISTSEGYSCSYLSLIHISEPTRPY